MSVALSPRRCPAPTSWFAALTPGRLRLLPLYVVIFLGFVGYSLMIMIFDPEKRHRDDRTEHADGAQDDSARVAACSLSVWPVCGLANYGFTIRPFRPQTRAADLFVHHHSMLCAHLDRSESRQLRVACPSLVVAGLAEANIVTAQSAIADVVPADQRNRFFGYIYMSISAAYIVGPLAGGKLADPELVSWFNYATPFLDRHDTAGDRHCSDHDRVYRDQSA